VSVGRVRVWYAIGIAVLAAGYFALPVIRPVFVAALGVLVIGAIEFGVRRLRPPRPGGWRRLEAALVLIATGSVVFDVLELRSPTPVPYPSVADNPLHGQLSGDRRRAAREQAARAASQAMVSATTPVEVEAGTRAALRAVLPKDSPSNVVLARQDGPDQRAAADGSMVMPLAGTGSVLMFTGPPAELTELTDLLLLLAHQAAVALQRINLAETAKAEERERYFRTLVVTSADVILISRDNRIEYATPSAERVFGRDVRGEQLENLIRAERTESAEGVEATIASPHGQITVMVHRRDLIGDPTVGGVVTSMRDITAERQLQSDLAYRASHDELTGLINARAWGETTAQEEDRRQEFGHGIGAMYIDLDNFKSINDRYGHAVGDEVLAEAGRRIRACPRTGDLAARVGGDEFSPCCSV
jgi:PAS domain-containing protein